MAFDAHVLKVLIASPSDTAEEREAVTRSLHGWNAARAERERVVLLPSSWETDAVPRLGASGQGVINEQLVDRADIVIALFDTRLGMATEAAVSGTAEEIQRAHAAGKPVHVYFSDEPIPRSSDLRQVEALERFKQTLMPLGLLGSYASSDDLGYQVRQAIESDLDRLNLGAVTRRAPAQEHAVLRARYEHDREPHIDSRGRTTYRTRRERLVVQNIGSVTAERVTPDVRGLGPDDQPPQLHGNETPNIVPNSEFSWPILTHAGTAQAVELELSWMEGADEHRETQHVSL